MQASRDALQQDADQRMQLLQQQLESLQQEHQARSPPTPSPVTAAVPEADPSGGGPEYPTVTVQPVQAVGTEAKAGAKDVQGELLAQVEQLKVCGVIVYWGGGRCVRRWVRGE